MRKRSKRRIHKATKSLAVIQHRWVWPMQCIIAIQRTRMLQPPIISNSVNALARLRTSGSGFSPAPFGRHIFWSKLNSYKAMRLQEVVMENELNCFLQFSRFSRTFWCRRCSPGTLPSDAGRTWWEDHFARTLLSTSSFNAEPYFCRAGSKVIHDIQSTVHYQSRLSWKNDRVYLILKGKCSYIHIRGSLIGCQVIFKSYVVATAYAL